MDYQDIEERDQAERWQELADEELDDGRICDDCGTDQWYFGHEPWCKHASQADR